MLSIAKLGVGQERYYLEQARGRVDVVTSVAGGVEDYYTDGPEVPGAWLGAGARRLGLAGVVDGDALRTVLAGATPQGAVLRSAAVKVAAFDLTFSAPKSVSMLFALGDEDVVERVRGAHDRAVQAAFGYLEREAGRVRRGAGGSTVLSANGLLAAGFRHRTSRLGDPQLHTHVVVANLAEGPDGRWSALDGRPLYAHARAASFIYQATLRRELTRELGVEWTRVRDGIAEVKGVPERVLKAFSRRRAQIERALEQRGVDGPRAAEAAALATRRAKSDVDPQTLTRRWEIQAEIHGFPAERVRRVIGRVRCRELEPEDLEPVFAELAGPSGLTEKASSFTRRDVIAALCERLPADAAPDIDALTRAATTFLASREVVPLAESQATRFVRRDGRALPADPAELRYSTRELLTLERRLVQRALNALGDDDTAPCPDDAAVARARERRPTLGREQLDMVRLLTRGDDLVAVVVGRAGTGKTYALGACQEAWREAGRPVLGAALARRAARELEDQAGIPSTSIAALVHGLQHGELLPPRSVLVIDEAAMVGTRQLATLLDAVETADGRLVLVGDDRQLPAIDAGGAFAHLARKLPAVELTDNRRQIHPWERDAVELVRDGRGHEAVQRYLEHDRIRIAPTPELAREQLVTRWWNAGDAVMLARRRDDVADLNRRAHELMRDTGRLGTDELELPGGAFAVGDQVLVRRNDPRLGIANGDRGTIQAINRTERTLAIQFGPDVIELPSAFLDACTDHGEPTLTHGYAITGHAAQGLTVDRAHILADPHISQEWAYTALTRGREANHLYLPETEDLAREEFAPRGLDPPDPLQRLATAISTPSQPELALDQLPPPVLEDTPSQIKELQARRDAAGQAAQAAREARSRLERLPAPLRLLRRPALTSAIATDEHYQHELTSAGRKLQDAKRRERERPELKLPELPGDPVARQLTRRLERRELRQRTRTLERSRGLGIDR